MPKFTNTEYKKTVDSLSYASKEKLNNPYYPFIQQKPTSVDYYNQNGEISTADPGMEQVYSQLGPNSPIRYNLIKGFLLYGLNQATVNYDVSEWGLESEPIEGEALILPNTIVPRPGDFFFINYTSEKALFRINSVTRDTLDNGSNIFKCEYKLTIPDGPCRIDEQVVDTFEFMVNNVGTDFKSIIRSTDYKIIEQLEMILISMSEYYNELFFDPRVQSYIYRYNGSLMYDPYMVEFLIRNKVLVNEKESCFVSHQMTVPKTFSIDYAKTLFHSIEIGDKNDIKDLLVGTATQIKDINSLFATRREPYYSVSYFNDFYYITKFNIFRSDVIKHCKDNEYYDKSSKDSIYNIWVAFFNDKNRVISDKMINFIENIDYAMSQELFYTIPITMYMIQYCIKNTIKALPTSK